MTNPITTSDIFEDFLTFYAFLGFSNLYKRQAKLCVKDVFSLILNVRDYYQQNMGYLKWVPCSFGEEILIQGFNIYNVIDVITQTLKCFP